MVSIILSAKHPIPVGRPAYTQPHLMVTNKIRRTQHLPKGDIYTCIF